MDLQSIQQKPPEKLLQDIDPTSTNIYGIDKEATGTSSPTNLAQEDIGVKQDTTNQPSGDGSGMKSVFYFHEDGRRIQVLMLNGRPISSVPADFNEFKEDTPENRKVIKKHQIQLMISQVVLVKQVSSW